VNEKAGEGEEKSSSPYTNKHHFAKQGFPLKNLFLHHQ
jgi:hypothetical protein